MHREYRDREAIAFVQISTRYKQNAIKINVGAWHTRAGPTKILTLRRCVLLVSLYIVYICKHG